MHNCIKILLSMRLKASVTGYKYFNFSFSPYVANLSPTLTGMDAVRNVHAWATIR
jgi:hypothetical protein